MLAEKLALREFHFIARRYEILRVRTIEETRHARLLQLLKSPEFHTVQALATKLDRSHAQVSQWKTRSKRRNEAGEVTGVSNIDSASARWIEERTGKPRGWMDTDPEFDKVRWPFGDRVDAEKVNDLPADWLSEAAGALNDVLRRAEAGTRQKDRSVA